MRSGSRSKRPRRPLGDLLRNAGLHEHASFCFKKVTSPTNNSACNKCTKLKDVIGRFLRPSFNPAVSRGVVTRSRWWSSPALLSGLRGFVIGSADLRPAHLLALPPAPRPNRSSGLRNPTDSPFLRLRSFDEPVIDWEFATGDDHKLPRLDWALAASEWPPDRPWERQKGVEMGMQDDMEADAGGAEQSTERGRAGRIGSSESVGDEQAPKAGDASQHPPSTPRSGSPTRVRPTLGHIRISDFGPLTSSTPSHSPSNSHSHTSASASPRCASAASRRSASPAPVASRRGAQLGPSQALAAGVDPSSLGAAPAGGRRGTPSPVRRKTSRRKRGGSDVGEKGEKAATPAMSRHRSSNGATPQTPMNKDSRHRGSLSSAGKSAHRVSSFGSATLTPHNLPFHTHSRSPSTSNKHARSVSTSLTSPFSSDTTSSPAPTIALSSVVAARPAPVLGGPGPSLPCTPSGVQMGLASGTASPVTGIGAGSPSGAGSASPVMPTAAGIAPWVGGAGGMGTSRPGSPNGIGSPKSSVLGVGSRSPSPTPRDDIIEGMSASTTSIFERDVEHADPACLPLTASDAIDLAIPPVLDEAVVTMLLPPSAPTTNPSSPASATGTSPSPAPAPPGSSTSTTGGGDPNIVTADSADPSSLIIEPLSAVLATGGVSASHPSGGWTEGPAAAAVALGGMPAPNLVHHFASSSNTATTSPRGSGLWNTGGGYPTLSAIGGPMPPASPPLSDRDSQQQSGAGGFFPPASPLFGRGRSGSHQQKTFSRTPTLTQATAVGGPSPPPSDMGDHPPTAATPGAVGKIGLDEASPPLSVASYPLSSSLSDPSSPRSLSPTGSQHGGITPLDGKLGGMLESPAHQHVGSAGPPVPGSLGSLALSGLALGPPPPAVGGAIGGGSRRLSFLSYADLINAERVEAAEREGTLGGSGVGSAGGFAIGGGVGKDEMPGLLWAALGDADYTVGGGRGLGGEEEEVLRGDGVGLSSEDEMDSGGRGRRAGRW